ncbi:substrate-binding periplasmic protein [Bdellovibrio bacteriovorus]|uniref:substrate-binding periplasmic protein n=1 Tax=Bdellovibrio bacteriovorus TaxID=959 RepID=UPI0035A724D2
MKTKLLYFLSFFILAHSAQAKTETEFRAAIPAGLAPPLLIEKEGKVDGLIVDYVNALAEAMGRTASFSVVTRYRLNRYMLTGQMDVLCYTSKIWDDGVKKLDFSEVLFNKKEVIIGPTPMPKKISDLQGKTIGTMLQYVYPKLDPYFASGKILREDSLSEEGNLKKLLNGRIQYVVTDQIFFDYFRLENPSIAKNREALFLRDYPIVCSVSRKGRITKKEVDKAIDDIKRSGKMKALFKKYGSTYVD